MTDQKKSKGPTDFNDLHLLKGLDAVRAQVIDAVDRFKQGAAQLPPAPTGDCEPPSYITDVPDDESPAPSIDSVEEAAEYMERMGRYSHERMIELFWFIWGTDTCWDSLNKKQIRLSHLRHGVGRERFKLWDESLERQCRQGIVFEPGQDLGKSMVNLFEGFAIQPNAKGAFGCQKILAHIWRMCGEREPEFEWLLKWIAYPLQNPGAKMDSSVIMYGSEGPGKSILWEKVVKRIYGKYGVTIGQAQLESQFTGWKSAKCFAVAEEVVSRAERNHHKGMLKQTVTGATHMINEKMLPEREETNHMNFVFLSNSTVPLELDLGDRRYLVLYVDGKPSKQYFDDLFVEIDGDGVACFMHHLLQMDLAGFDSHTQPPMNREKDELIAASMSSPLYFHRLWKAGELDIPYQTAGNNDLFKAFQRWSDRQGEFKRTQRFFSSELSRVMTQHRRAIKYPREMDSPKTQRFWLTEDDLQQQHEENFIEGCAQRVREFRELVAGASNDD